MSEHNMKTVLPFALLSVALVVYLAVLPRISHADATSAVNVWWPTNSAHLTGNQPLKAMVPGMDVSQYDMFWQVDGGQLNSMDNNYTDYQHKETTISVDSWNWHGSGPYTLTFVAKQNGNIVAQQSEQIYIDNGLPASPTVQLSPVTVQTSSAPVTPAQTQPSPTQTSTVQTVASPVISFNTGSGFYVDTNSQAANQANAWATSNQSGAAAMQVLAAQPTASWFGDWNSNIQNDVHTLVTKAQGQGTMPVIIAYNIPQRDCGSYSAGGANNPSGYTQWIQSFAAGIGSAPATVILEPDSLSQITCLSAKDQATRLKLLTTAVRTLKANSNTKVYIDAGHSGWVDATTMAGRLAAADVNLADGFALNVSNFDATSNETTYGAQVSNALSGFIGDHKHFVVDTSRNGNGSNGEWCNPSGRAIGTKPTTNTGDTLTDAYLWLKTPGESDGTCNGGPSAGTWWPSYAQALVQNAH